MGYEHAMALIDAELRQIGKHSGFLRAAAKRYADLTRLDRDDRAIYCSWLAHEDTTHVELATENGVVRIYAYLELEDDLGRVYSGKIQDAWSWLHSMKQSPVAAEMQRALVLSTRGEWDRVLLGAKS